jgi:hypothetical protein
MSGSIGIETLRHWLIVSEEHTISFFLRLEVWLQEATLTRFWTKHPEFRKIIVTMQSAGARRVLIIVAVQSSGCSQVWLCRLYYHAHTKLSLPMLILCPLASTSVHQHFLPGIAGQTEVAA